MYHKYAVLKVPFPFTDSNRTKHRPAVAISNQSFNNTSKFIILAMITTAKHSQEQTDYEILDLKSAGLSTKCVIRMKIFSVDKNLIHGMLGTLSAQDAQTLDEKIRTAL